MTDSLLNFILLIIYTLTLGSAFNEMLVFKHPAMIKIIWGILFPTYVLLIVTGIGKLFTKLPFILDVVNITGTVVFFISIILVGIIIGVLKWERKKYQFNISKM